MGKVDDVTKNYIGQNDKFADICNFFLFDGKQNINPSELVEQDSTELEVILGDGQSASVQKLRDVLKKTVIKSDGKTMYMIVGIENQKDIHYAMVIKNMVYDTLNYASQVENIAKEHRNSKDVKGSEFLSGFAKTDKLIPVITITVYWSSGTWDGPRSLHEMFTVKDERILQFVPNYNLNLIVPDEIKDFSKFKTELENVFQFVASSGNKRKMKSLYKNKSDVEISIEAANLLNICFDAKITFDNSKGVVRMCKGMQDWGEEIKAQGIAEGKVEGMALAYAKMYKKNKITKEEAAEFAGMSLEKFEEFLATLE